MTDNKALIERLREREMHVVDVNAGVEPLVDYREPTPKELEAATALEQADRALVEKDAEIARSNDDLASMSFAHTLAEERAEAAEAKLASARAEALEEAATYHDAEATKYQKRLDRQAGRRDIPAMEASIGGRVIGFGGTEVSRYREALQDEISSHQISAKRIRALIPESNPAEKKEGPE